MGPAMRTQSVKDTQSKLQRSLSTRPHINGRLPTEAPITASRRSRRRPHVARLAGKHTTHQIQEASASALVDDASSRVGDARPYSKSHWCASSRPGAPANAIQIPARLSDATLRLTLPPSYSNRRDAARQPLPASSSILRLDRSLCEGASRPSCPT